MADTALPSKDDLSNITSSLKSVSKALEKVSAQLLKQKKEVGGLEDKSKEILKLQEKQKKNGQEINGVLKSMNDFASDLRDVGKEILSGFGELGHALGSLAVTGFFARAIKDSFQLNNEMTRLSWQLGAQGKNVKELTGAVNGLQKEFGVSYQQASGLIKTLSQKRYVDNIYQAAAGISLFSKATGVTDTYAADLADTLNKAAGMSTASINAMLAGMTGVQQEIGVSAAGMNALVSSIGNAAVNMAAFGKSSDQIKAMAAQTTALVGSMEKVGIAAAETLQIVEKLTDPDRIEDNILLYSQLGVSIEDAISGNVDLSTMDGQLKDMAQRIVDMGPIAGSQFAKSMGLSYKQATQMAKMEGDEVAGVSEGALTSEEKALDTMKQMEAQSAGFLDKAEKAFNRIEGGIRSMGPAVLLVMGILIPKLLKNATKSLGNFFSPKGPQMSVIEEGIGSAVAQGFEKGKDKAEEKITSLGKVVTRSVQTWFDASKAGKFFKGYSGQIDGLIAKAKKESPLDQWYTAKKQDIFDNYRKGVADMQAGIDGLQKKMAEIGVPKGVLDDFGTFSSFVNSVNKDNEKLFPFKSALDEAKAFYGDLEENKKNFTKKMQASIKNLRPETADKVVKADKQVSEKQAELGKLTAAQEQLLSIEQQVTATAKEAAELRAAAQHASDEEAKILKASADALEGKNNELAESYKAQLKILGVSDDEIKNEKNMAELVRKGLNKRKDVTAAVKAASDSLDRAVKKQQKLNEEVDEEIKKRKSGPGRIIGGIASGIKGRFQKSNFYKNAVEAVKEGKAKTVKGAMGKAAAKGVGKGALGIMKMLGPMAIVMSVVGKLIDKIKEPLQEMMDTIVDAMGPIVKAMMPVIKTLMETIATKILPPLLTVAGYIWKAIGTVVGKPLIAILRLLGKLPWLGGMFNGLADTVEKLTDGTVADSMIAAAGQLEKISFDKKKENEESQQAKPEEIKAKGASFEKISDAQEATKSSSQEATSTTQSTSEKKPTDQVEKLEIQNEKKRQKKRDEKFEELMTEMNVNLGAMYRFWQDQGDYLKNLSQTATRVDDSYLTPNEKPAEKPAEK